MELELELELELEVEAEAEAEAEREGDDAIASIVRSRIAPDILIAFKTVMDRSAGACNNNVSRVARRTVLNIIRWRCESRVWKVCGRG